MLFAILVLLVAAARADEPFIVLKNAADPGTRMSASGLGTSLEGCYNASASARQPSLNASLIWLKVGGRRFDGAISYGCDRGIGIAVRQSGISRSSVFITSKIGPGGLPFNLGYNETLDQAKRILADLAFTGSDSYIDLLLVHEPFTYWPDPFDPRVASAQKSTDPACNISSSNPLYSETGCRLSTWRAMVKLWKQKKTRSIGVSNFNSTHISEIITAGLPLPAVNQLEFSPHHGPSHKDCTCGHSTARSTQTCYQQGQQNQSCTTLFDFCKQHGVAVNGYSPFAGAPDLFNEKALVQIAAAHNVSSSQVILNWQWRHGVTVNPAATNEQYQRENLFFHDFVLSDDEMAVLDTYRQSPYDE
jgi:diketogulonate reductase-like aldo/keto reductase